MSDIEWCRTSEIDPDYRREIRERFRWEQVLTKLGIAFRTKPSGKIIILCRYHGEKSPSLHFWPNGSYLCHGCHRGHRDGDIAGFVFDELQGERWNSNFGAIKKSELDAFFKSLELPVTTTQLSLSLPDP